MAEHRPALAHEPDDDLVAARVEAAWRDLVAAMELRYPVATWPDDRLRDARQKLLEDALSHGELGTKSELGGLRDDASRHYQSAAEMRADAYAMGVVLAERGDESMHYDVCETTDALERVVRGEGPARRIVTSRDENGQKIDLVLDDEEADRTFRAIWEQAARYAHPYRFADVAEPAAAEMLEQESSQKKGDRRDRRRARPRLASPGFSDVAFQPRATNISHTLTPSAQVMNSSKRHGFHEPHTVLGVLAHWVGLAGTMAPIVIGELIADPAKSRKWVRLSAVGSTVAFQALHTVRELLHRKEQEKKLAECQSRGG